jgi:hypothetical protein
MGLVFRLYEGRKKHVFCKKFPGKKEKNCANLERKHYILVKFYWSRAKDSQKIRPSQKLKSLVGTIVFSFSRKNCLKIRIKT